VTNVSFDASGGVASVTRATIANGRAWGFGDIAIRDDGVLFGSGFDFGLGGADLFTIDLNAPGGPSATYLLDQSFEVMQLSFIGGALYGLRTGTDQVVRVDTLTGEIVPRVGLDSAALQINDLATVPSPAAGALGLLAALAASRRRR
jgi:hypothetical protein